MANHMEKVAKMLGLEFGEEFEVKRNDEFFHYTYKFTKEALKFKRTIDEEWSDAPFTLFEILQDDSKIIKLPFKPEMRDCYWYVEFNEYEGATAFNTRWLNSCTDYSRLKTGNCFRTEEEAEANKFKIYKELTGKEWGEE